MKHIFTTVLFALTALTINAQKQNDIEFVRNLIAKYNLNAATSEDRSTYLLLSDEAQYYKENGNKSGGPSRNAYTYDKNGYPLTVLSTVYDSLSKKWVEASKYDYTNDSKGNPIKVAFYSMLDSKWVKTSTSDLTYDANFLPKTFSYKSFNIHSKTPDSTVFEVYGEHTHDANKNLVKTSTKIVNKYFSPASISYECEENTYDANKLKVSSKLFTGKNINSLDWENQQFYIYDTNKNLTKRESFGVVNGVKADKVFSRTTNTYNNKNLLVTVLNETTDFFSGLLVEYGKYICTYDANNNKSNEKYHSISGTTGKLFYNSNRDYKYSLFVDAKDVPAISFNLSPNPTNNILRIVTGETILSYAIYDLEGRILMSAKGNDNIIDVTNFEKGAYFLKVQTEKGVGTSKFIKQ